MSRFLTTRRSEWLPGLAILCVAVCVAGLVGGSIGARSWATYVGLAVAVILVLGWIERRRATLAAPAPKPRPRTRLRVIEGGKTGFDLEKDHSTDDQKYVM
jgi:hypothetical protein